MQALVKFVIGFILMAFLVMDSLSIEENASKQILILASYNPGLKWTDSSGSTIENEISIYYPTADFSFEYMDTKSRHPQRPAWLNYLNYIKINTRIANSM